MLKSLVLGSSITFLSALSLPAFATDWRTTGVSTRTRETVAIDMDSINRVSRYDVRFRYLIGKDLVQASVNCDSSLVTPDQGKPFVPDMTGATREMIKLACGDTKSRGYDRRYSSLPDLNLNYELSQSDAYQAEFVSDEAVASVRRLLALAGMNADGISNQGLRVPLARFCNFRIQGATETNITNAINNAIAQKKLSSQMGFVLITSQVVSQRICPEHVRK